MSDALVNLALVDQLRRLPQPMRRALYGRLAPGALATRRYDWRTFWARPDQIAPPHDADWRILLFDGQRGGGKSRALFQYMDEEIETGRARAPRIIAATAADIEGTVVFGDSGIMAITPPERRPRWQPSKGNAGLLIYPNGVRVRCCAAAEPGQLVGMNTDLDIMDDPAKWPETTVDEAWNHARASCRVGYARTAIATTFRKTNVLRRLIKKGDFTGLVVRHLNAQDNAGNLNAEHLRDLGEMDEWFLRREYGGIDDNLASPFAALNFSLPPIRITEVQLEDLAEIVVAVDPAEGKGPHHDDWGIGAAGRRRSDKHIVVLEDATLSADDGEGAAAVLDLCERWGARKIIVETNKGPRAENAIKAVFYKRKSEGRIGELPEIVRVTAREKKLLRAGPVIPLYLGGLVHHLPGLVLLERQAREWDPEAPPRPKQDDRIDWLVHAISALAGIGADTSWEMPKLQSAPEVPATGGLPWMKERSAGHSPWLRNRR